MHGSGCRHISTKARLPHHCPQETERRTHVAAGVSAELAALQVNPGLSVATGIHNWSEDHPVSFIHSDPDGGGAGPSSPVYGVPFLNLLEIKNGLRWPALKQRRAMSASLIGHSGSSAFRLSTTTVSMSLTGFRPASEHAPAPRHARNCQSSERHLER